MRPLKRWGRSARTGTVSRSDLRGARSSVLVTLICMTAVRAGAQPLPAADYHQHLLSPVIAGLLSAETESSQQSVLASDVIAQLDAAGIRRAAVMSVAYLYGSPSRVVDDEYAKVRAENDWTSAQIAQYSDRLLGFCSVNPLKAYALDEIARCSRDPNLHFGIKLHFGNSGVRLDEAEHVEQLRRVFRAANRRGMAIVVDLQSHDATALSGDIGQARALLEQLLPEAPDVPIQLAHIASGLADTDPAADSAFAFLASAVAAHDSRVAHVWFDATSLVSATLSPTEAAHRIRQLGVDRIVFGSDLLNADESLCMQWSAFLRLPLTADEFRTIATNVVPYMPRLSRLTI